MGTAEDLSSILQFIGHICTTDPAETDAVSKTKESKIQVELKTGEPSDLVYRPTGPQLCRKCDLVAEEPLITPCFHVFCANCLTEAEASFSMLDHPLCTAQGCGEYYEDAEHYFPDEATEDDTDPTSVEISESGMSIRQLEKAIKRCKSLPEGEVQDWVDPDTNKLWCSSKARFVKEQLIQAVKSGKKVILFTQWHPLVATLQRVCGEEAITCCQYTGKVTAANKIKAADAFQKDLSVMVMIATLKSAGVGLNLTAGSVAINIDSR